MIRYFNLKTAQGVETIDELDRSEFQAGGFFRKELQRLAQEYHMAGMRVYISTRATKEWRTRHAN